MNNEEKILEMLTEMKSDISGLKSDVSGLKSDVSELKAVQAEQGKKLDEIDKRSERTAVLLEGEIGPKVQLLFEAVSTHAQTLEKKERVDRIEETLDQKAVVLESITKSHTERIEKLEKAI